MPGDTLTSGIDSFRQAALSCPLPAAVELIGEKWAFLILRGAFNGLAHFEEIGLIPTCQDCNGKQFQPCGAPAFDRGAD